MKLYNPEDDAYGRV